MRTYGRDEYHRGGVPNFGGVPVFVDTAMASTWMPVKEFSERVRELGARRVLFGTDLPWGRMGQEIAFVEKAKLSKQEKNKYSTAMQRDY